MRTIVRGIMVFVLSGFFVTSSYAAEKGVPPAQFYGSKIVENICTTGAGGTVDFAARLFASHWPEYAKGGSMVVANNKGGGGIASHNYIMKGRTDGLTIGTASHSSAVGYPLYKAQGVQWSIKEIHWVGMIGKDVLAFSLSPKLPYNSLDELKKAKGLRLGGLGPGGNISLGAAFIATVLGLDARVILGYTGSTELAVASAKGELDGYVENSAGLFQRIKQGFSRSPLLVLSFKRSPVFPNIPAASEAIKLTPEQQTWLSFFEYIPQGSSIFVRDGVPADRVKFLQDGFDKIVATKSFQTQMKTFYGSWSEPVSNKQLADEVSKLTTISGDAVDRFVAEADKYTAGRK